jgi:peptide/nickel transport system ATP-binding protein
MSTIDEDEPLLEVDDVSVTFGDNPLMADLLPESMRDRWDLEADEVHAVENVSLDVGEEDVIAIVGESGSGKTTLARTAVALQDATSGSIRYRGHEVEEVRSGTHDGDIFFEDIRRALQIVHQDPDAALNPYRSLMASLEEPLKLWNPELSQIDRRERILQLLDRIGLTPAPEFQNRYPHQLSGGEKQRVAILRAMLCEPDLIMADEPVSALDPSLRVEIMDLMLELQEMFETSYVIISHNLEHARYIASKADGRIAIMYMGEIVEIGPAEEVIQNPQHPYTKILKWSTLPLHPDAAREALEIDLPLRKFDIPEPGNKPSGCRFHTRCPKAREACAEEHPTFVQDEDTAHRSACFREDESHRYWDTEPLEEGGEIEIPE